MANGIANIKVNPPLEHENGLQPQDLDGGVSEQTVDL